MRMITVGCNLDHVTIPTTATQNYHAPFVNMKLINYSLFFLKKSINQ